MLPTDGFVWMIVAGEGTRKKKDIGSLKKDKQRSTMPPRDLVFVLLSFSSSARPPLPSFAYCS